MTEQYPPSAQSDTGTYGAAPSEAAVGPFSIRDLVVLGSVAIIFVASLIPIVSNVAGSFNLWNISGLFYIGVGVILPLAVGGLFLVRRLSPAVTVRIGSLSTDQFASVVAAFATFFFFTGTVTNFGVAYLVGLVGSLLLLAGTACALWIPMLAKDFAGRAEVPAHVAARDAVPALKRSTDSASDNDDAAGIHGSAQGHHAGDDQGTASLGENGQDEGGAQSSSAWVASPTPGSHTAAGQIFTPAKETNPVRGSAGQSAATGAAASIAAASSTAAEHAAEQAVSAAAPGAAAAKSAANTTAAVEGGSPTPAGATISGATPGGTTQSSSTQPTKAESVTSHDSTNASAAGQPGTVHSAAHSGSAAATTVNPQVAVAAKESIAATVHSKPAAAVVSTDPFWFAVDRPQNVIDEDTRRFLFKLAPGAWILALEDRGSSFLVQDNNGKIGILLDLVGIERAPVSQ